MCMCMSCVGGGVPLFSLCVAMLHSQTCRDQKLMMEIILNRFSSWFVAAGSHSQTQNSRIWLILLGSLFWVPLLHPGRLELQMDWQVQSALTVLWGYTLLSSHLLDQHFNPWTTLLTPIIFQIVSFVLVWFWMHFLLHLGFPLMDVKC